MENSYLLKLLNFITYRNDLEIINQLKDVINGTHPVIFKTCSIKKFLYCYKGNFKPLSKIGWTNYKTVYSLMNDKNVSELTIYNFNKDFKVIHIGEQMNLKCQRTYFDFILENRTKNKDFFNKYTMFNNTIYKKDELELLNKNIMSLLFKSIKELKENSFSIFSDDFLSVVCDIMKLTGLNLMNTIDFEEKDIFNILNLFDNCSEIIYLQNVDGYTFSNQVHLSDITENLLK